MLDAATWQKAMCGIEDTCSGLNLVRGIATVTAEFTEAFIRNLKKSSMSIVPQEPCLIVITRRSVSLILISHVFQLPESHPTPFNYTLLASMPQQARHHIMSIPSL